MAAMGKFVQSNFDFKKPRNKARKAGFKSRPSMFAAKSNLIAFDSPRVRSGPSPRASSTASSRPSATGNDQAIGLDTVQQAKIRRFRQALHGVQGISKADLDTLTVLFDDDIYCPLVHNVAPTAAVSPPKTAEEVVRRALASTSGEYTTLAEFRGLAQESGFQHLVPEEFFSALASMSMDSQDSQDGDRGLRGSSSVSPRHRSMNQSSDSPSSSPSSSPSYSQGMYIMKDDILGFCESLGSDLVQVSKEPFSEADKNCKSQYAQLAASLATLVESEGYSTLVVLVISTYGLITGLQTYDDKGSTVDTFLFITELLCVLFFTVEVAMRIMAEGLTPLRYFYDTHIDHDEFYTSAQMQTCSKRLSNFARSIQGWNLFDFTVVVVSLLPVASILFANARALRLVKVLEMLHKMPQLAAISIGLLNAMTSVAFICLLFLLVFYLFSIVGIALFHENDAMHFANLHSSMITLASIALDDWVDVMNLNIYGCLAPEVKYATIEMRERFCPPAYAGSNAMGVWAVLYFAVFISLSYFIGCSLFIGVMTTFMADSTKELNDKIKEKHKIKREKQFADHLQKSREKGSRSQHLAALHSAVHMTTLLAHTKSNHSEPNHSELSVVSDTFDTEEPDSERHHHETCRDKYERMSLGVDTFVESVGFHVSILLVICFGGVLVGMETYYKTAGEIPSSLEVLHTILLFVFIVEAVLKIIAQGLHPWAYFYVGWNVYDFIVLMVDIFIPGSHAAVLRTIRVLQVVKMMKHVPELTMIIHGLENGLTSMTFSMLLLSILFYLYAFVGVLWFKDNDLDNFGQLHHALLTLFKCATEDWRPIMYKNMYGCDQFYRTTPCDGQDVTKAAESMSLAPLYFISFQIFSALIVINIVTGSITASMQGESEMHHERKSLRQSIKLYKDRFPSIPHKSLDEWLMAIDHTEAFVDNILDHEQVDHVMEVLDVTLDAYFVGKLTDIMTEGGGICTIPDLLEMLCQDYMMAHAEDVAESDPDSVQLDVIRLEQDEKAGRLIQERIQASGLDADGDGMISFSEIDKDGDGKISAEEFEAMQKVMQVEARRSALQEMGGTRGDTSTGKLPEMAGPTSLDVAGEGGEAPGGRETRDTRSTENPVHGLTFKNLGDGGGSRGQGGGTHTP